MTRPTIHQVHIADGFADDCEDLIHQCLKTETLTYESFCEIWKDKQFGYLYHGRASGTEMAELSEELLFIAKHYMVANTSNLEESIAGLFIVYGILNLQPFPGFAALRIVHEDIPAINRIEMAARRQKRYDVLYILGSILIEGPVQYHAASRERGMEPALKKYLEGYTSIDRLGVRPKGVFYRQNEELDIIRELNSITRRYSDAKKAIGGENNRNLNFINVNFASELDASLKKILNGVIEKTDEADEKIKDHYSKVQAIKERAIKLSVDGVKYLQSSADTDKSPTKSSPTSSTEKNCKSKKPPGTLKKPQESPKKPLGSPTKSPGSAKKVAKKQRNIFRANKRKHFGSESSTSVSEVSSIGDSDDDDLFDLDLDKFDKNKSNEVDEQEVNIVVDSLPDFVRTEQGGKTFEIEFIDQCEGKRVVDKDLNKQVDNMKYVSIEKNNDAGEGTSSGASSAAMTKLDNKESKVIDDPLMIKRPERRDLKKTIMKSKFQRMGMLTMANFDEKQKSKKAKKKDSFS